MENNQEQFAPQPVPSEPPQAPQPSSPKPAMLKWLLIVLLFFLALLGGVLYVQNTNKSQISTVVPTQIPQTSPSPTPPPVGGLTANWKTYKSKYNKYIFDYPNDLSLQDSSSIYLKKGPESNLSFLVEIVPKTRYISEKEKSFRDWAVEQFQARCLSDGPNSSTYCDKVIKEVSFTNKYGLKVYEIHSNQIHEVDNNQSSQIIGPMFAIDVSEKTNNSTYGLLVIPSYGLPSKNEEEVSRKIIDTFRFTDEDSSTTSQQQFYCGSDPSVPPEKQCPSGYECVVAANILPNGGKCVKK